MSAPTPDAVAREIVDRACAYVPELAAVLRERDRAARAAAIEEAADKFASAILKRRRNGHGDLRDDDATRYYNAGLTDAVAAIRALGEESAG